jgi:tetratricopeptide (TPR) repeat protein
MFYNAKYSVEHQRKRVMLFRKELSNHPADIAKAQFRLAISYQSVGSLKEAHELIVEMNNGVTIEHGGPITPRADAIQHMDRLWSMENADDIHQYIEQSQSLLKFARILFGSDSPEALSEMRNLGTLYRFGGYREEALQLFKDVLESRQSTSGKEHSETLEAIQDISDIYCDMERKPELLSVRQELLEITRREFGEEVPRTLRAMEQMAVSYAGSGQGQESLEILTRIEATRRKPLRLRLPQGKERRCDFCYDLNLPRYAIEEIDLSKARLNPYDCPTCPIVEQALLFYQPDWKEGFRTYKTFSLINAGRSLILTDNSYGMKSYGGVELFINDGMLYVHSVYLLSWLV